MANRSRIEVYPEHSADPTSKLRYRWRIRSSNGQITASSNENFHSATNAKRAAVAIVRNARKSYFNMYFYEKVDSKPVISSIE
jgi:uncharacterized protein YegP (UPF0339 family)